jgi:uncharacterized protein (DUF4415 family)
MTTNSDDGGSYASSHVNSQNYDRTEATDEKCMNRRQLVKPKDLSADNSPIVSFDKDNDTIANTAKSSRRVTMSLALDAFVVEEIKKQTIKYRQSFNARINAILEKYVTFFMGLEENHAAIFLPRTHQFFINEIDEAKYTDELKAIGTDNLDAMFVQTGLPNTLDNLLKYTYEGLWVNGGFITGVKKFIDKGNGKTCLYFAHEYDLKWSRILSASFAHHMGTLLGYHTSAKLFSKGFEIKILETNPI